MSTYRNKYVVSRFEQGKSQEFLLVKPRAVSHSVRSDFETNCVRTNVAKIFVVCGMSLKYPNLQTLNTLLLSILLDPFPRCVISARCNETVCTQTIPGKIRQIATLARLISVIIYPDLSIGNYCVFYSPCHPQDSEQGQEWARVPVSMSGVSYEVVSSQTGDCEPV